MTDSNRRHSACKADALPTELITLSNDTDEALLHPLRKRKLLKGNFLKTIYLN